MDQLENIEDEKWLDEMFGDELEDPLNYNLKSQGVQRQPSINLGYPSNTPSFQTTGTSHTSTSMSRFNANPQPVTQMPAQQQYGHGYPYNQTDRTGMRPSSQASSGGNGRAKSRNSDENEDTPGILDPLVKKFRYVKEKRKLNLKLVSNMLHVSRHSLSKWNSGKNDQWGQRHIVFNWLGLPENQAILKDFHDTTSHTQPTQSSQPQGVNSALTNYSHLQPSSRGGSPMNSYGHPAPSRDTPSPYAPKRRNSLTNPSANAHNYAPISSTGYHNSSNNHNSNSNGYSAQRNPNGQHHQASGSFGRNSLYASQRPDAQHPQHKTSGGDMSALYSHRGGSSSSTSHNMQPLPPNPTINASNSNYSRPGSRVNALGSGVSEPPSREGSSAPGTSKEQSIRLLAQLLKQETNHVLHKDIDSAIQDYLSISRNLLEKMTERGEDSASITYYYSNQSKVVMSRLTTICGKEAIQKAFAELQRRRAATPGSAPYPSHSSSSPFPDISSSRAVTSVSNGSQPRHTSASSSSNRASMETQQMAMLTKIWNHCCSCREDHCAFPNCAKIKPSMLHQKTLRSENKECTTEKCNHCALYQRLRSFATVSQSQHRGATQAPGDYSASSTKDSSHSSFSTHSTQKYQQSHQLNYKSTANVQPAHPSQHPQPSQLALTNQIPKTERRSPAPSGGPTTSNGDDFSQSKSYTENNTFNNTYAPKNSLHAQQNTVNNNVNYSNMNFNYNTYNIVTQPKAGNAVKSGANLPHTQANTKQEKGAFRSRNSEDEDMSSLVDILDERKHNVNINVNVNINDGRNNPNGRHGVPQGQQSASHAHGNGQPVKRKTVPSGHCEPKKPKRDSMGSFGMPGVEKDDFEKLFEDLKTPPVATPKSNISPAVSNRNNAFRSNRVLCTVCQQKDRDSLFIPCNHCCACRDCAKQLTNCPMCRQPISSTSLIYLS